MAQSQEPHQLRKVYPNAKSPGALVYTSATRSTLDQRSPILAAATKNESDGRSGRELLYVVISADTVIRPDEPVTPAHPLQMAIIPKNDFQLLPAKPHESARSITHDPEHLEPALPGSRHYGMVIGAFDPAQFCDGCVVVLYRIERRQPSGRAVHAAWARITAADVAAVR